MRSRGELFLDERRETEVMRMDGFLIRGRWRRRIVVLAVTALIGTALVREAGAQDMEKSFPKEFNITRAENPFAKVSNAAGTKEDALTVRAAPWAKQWEAVAGLDEFATEGRAWLALDRQARALVVNAAFFDTLTRRDATRLDPGVSLVIGVVKDKRLLARPDLVFAFALKAQLIVTYWHVEAFIHTTRFVNTAKNAEADFQARHVYFTSRKNEESYAFGLRLDKATGQLSLVALPSR
jgi:hypothetical protein